MSTLNPDFRGCDEVEVPEHLRHMPGWAPGESDLQSATDKESRAFDRLAEEVPQAFQGMQQAEPIPEMLAKWNEFQASKGRYPGSADWSLLDEFVHGEPLVFLPQIIGSCVMSNTFRCWVIRNMYQIVLQGRSEEYIGRNEFGTKNYAFYCPWSYGMARKRANMRRGDGLYCEPMAASLLKDGVIPCTTPALIALCNRLGVGRDKDYPEPQNASVYRAFGNWSYLDELAQYADYRVIDLPMVKSADQLWDCLGECKTAFVCSGEAIHKIGTHKDGFPIHARNPRDSWSHNMAFHGRLVASDGERFFRQSNESWGAQHIYNRRFAEVDKAIRGGGLTIAAIGEIDAPKSSPPLVA